MIVPLALAHAADAGAHTADPGLTLSGAMGCEGEVCTLHARFVNTRPHARVLIDPVAAGRVVVFAPWFSLDRDPAPSPLLAPPYRADHVWFNWLEVPANAEKDVPVRLDECAPLAPGEPVPTATLRYDTRPETLAASNVRPWGLRTSALTWARRHGAFRGVLVSDPFPVPCASGFLLPAQPNLRVLAP